MRILSIHNVYQIRGGEEESRDSEERLLRENGHIVDSYEETNHDIEQYSSLQVALKSIWSQKSYHIVKEKLKRHPYDVVHVQNFFPLISPSVYYAAQSMGVPVVQTLRNYRLICPNSLFFRDGQVCEDCLGKPIPYPGVVHGCYRTSRAVTGVTAAMLTSHRLARTWQKQVDVFIALTDFAKQKMIEGGLPAQKIVVKPNFVNPDPGPGSGAGNFALYVGRLSVEKGLDTLIEAWRQLEQPIQLKIIGDGPLAPMVEQAAQELTGVEWLGKKPIAEVHRLMGEASFLVFPSKWYETFGRVAVEAFAKGTPVIAANIGAIAELVENGVTGLHFEPGNAYSLAQSVKWMLNHPEHHAEMRHQARKTYLERYTSYQNYDQIMAIYKQAQLNANVKLTA
ncbi:glycosyltransferase [Nodosilinea sp. LEGE 07298]|uniref:glycosyltransferase n=1 Tax=Nodosilinea sp. LEGE 07298 TaxID=2777970 RepID=UPI00187F7E86|nr:glycosyltransferase [Nodosilinea sp. LEGE 07298]MBE9109967.1 glycosyltransferase [Nodosilinea sp. LEGE 07298]